MTDAPLSVDAFRQVAQRSTDLERSVAFYRDVLGASHIATFDPPGLAFFDIGGARLILHAIPGALEHQASPPAFSVDDLDASVAALREAGVAIEEAPTLINKDEAGNFGPAGAEEWMAFFRDPDGNILAFSEIRAP